MEESVSIKTIAKETGFSVSTVSRVVNGHAREYRISEETEELILEICEKYKYSPNPIAVNLRVKKSFTIGLVIPSLDNPFFVNITSILNRELNRKGYSIILTESNDDPENEEKLIKQLFERNIDGLLLIPCKDRNKSLPLLKHHFEKGTPIICIDRYIKDSNIPYITTDNTQGAYEGVKYLIGKGHKDIACIQGLVNSTPCNDRKAGYLKALNEFDLTPFYIGGDDFSIECGYRETKAILEHKSKPDAIFAMSSTIALGAMKALKEKEYEIPEDISLIGFDDNIFLDYLSTPLTTIAQPVEEISERAAKALVNHLEDKASLFEWNNMMLKTKIIHRESIK